MSRHYKRKIDGDEYKFPSCTTIISDCTDSSGALTQWAANQVVEYMKEHLCDDPFCPYKGSEIFEKLEKARFNFRKVSQKALDIGSEVHWLIEDYLKYTYLDGGGGIWKYPKGLIPEIRNAFGAFLDWSNEVNLDIIYNLCVSEGQLGILPMESEITLERAFQYGKNLVKQLFENG